MGQWPRLVQNCNRSLNMSEKSVHLDSHQNSTASYLGIPYMPLVASLSVGKRKNMFCSVNPKIKLNLTIADENIMTMTMTMK